MATRFNHSPVSMKIYPALLALLLPVGAAAMTYEYPPPEFSLIGTVDAVEASYEDTLLDIARRYSIGQEEIVLANPDVDRWLPGAGTVVVIPSQFVLPQTPHEGLVLNLPEMRLYYYPKREKDDRPQVQTYPVGIGRVDWATPLGQTRLVDKVKDPSWRPPESIRREHAAEGDPLPVVVPPGPNNPLGRYAMRLGIPGYLIHSTNKGFGVGMRVSHGCIRMAPEDIEKLFPQIPVGTSVRIVNQPAKAGWYGGKLYLEIHPPLEEDLAGRARLLDSAFAAIETALQERNIEVDEAAVRRVIKQQSGMPEVVSVDS